MFPRVIKHLEKFLGFSCFVLGAPGEEGLLGGPSRLMDHRYFGWTTGPTVHGPFGFYNYFRCSERLVSSRNVRGVFDIVLKSDIYPTDIEFSCGDHHGCEEGLVHSISLFCG